MADVATNAKGTTEKNGTIVTAVDVHGNYKTIDAVHNDAQDAAALETKYTNRFDDPRYYAGDAVG